LRDAHSAELNKLGCIPILKARMNADLHMADDLKNTGKGNLFVIFGARRLSRPPFAAIIVRSTEGLDADDASRTQ
jgi:hypothetical protein